jgi:hypothetical protein
MFTWPSCLYCCKELNISVIGLNSVVTICTTCFSILQLWILRTECICAFRMVLTINCDFLPKQHLPVGIRSGNVMCFLRGKKWNLIYYLEELHPLKGYGQDQLVNFFVYIWIFNWIYNKSKQYSPSSQTIRWLCIVWKLLSVEMWCSLMKFTDVSEEHTAPPIKVGKYAKRVTSTK